MSVSEAFDNFLAFAGGYRNVAAIFHHEIPAISFDKFLHLSEVDQMALMHADEAKRGEEFIKFFECSGDQQLGFIL